MSKDKETKKEEVNENIENVNENVSTEECDNRQEAELSIEEKLQKELDEANEKIANLESSRFHQGQSDHFEPPGIDSEISQPFNRPSSPNVNRCSRTEAAAFDIVNPIM